MYFLVLFLYYFVGGGDENGGAGPAPPCREGPAPPFSVLWLRVGEGGWGWQASEILERV